MLHLKEKALLKNLKGVIKMTKTGKHLIIIGAGSLGVITLDAALEMNRYKSIYFLDDHKNTNCLIHNFEVLGGLNRLYEINKSDYEFIIAIADNRSEERRVGKESRSWSAG